MIINKLINEDRKLKKLKFNGLKALCISVLISLFSVAANAAVINFNSLGGANAGTVSYDGVSGVLKGSNIDIGDISGIGTAANAGNITCIACQLNFETGLLNMNASAGSHYAFDAGGFFRITGMFDTGTAMIDGISTPLLLGLWTSQITVDILAGGAFAVSQGSGTDTKHADLLSFFGETGPFNFANANISLADLTNPVLQPLAAFDTKVTQAIVSNVNPVPVPGAVWLMGSALIGLVGARRRKV